MTHKKWIAILLIGALLPVMPVSLPVEAADYSKLYLNEICTQNKNSLLDSYGTASDWIEFYNAGDEPLALDGLGVTDDASNPMKWTFPSGVTIAANSYFVIFASKQASTDTEYHTGFGLSKSGETITLSSADGTRLQQVIVPALEEDQTYGRSPSGSETFAFMSPTPKADNLIAVSAPSFSAGSGFYDTDFTLTLQADAGNTIYYTLDGSDPTTSETAVLYEDGISIYNCTSEPNRYSAYKHDDTAQSITLDPSYSQAPTYPVDKATVVRAVAKDANGKVSEIITNTYFRLSEEQLAFYEGIPVISLVSDPAHFFDPDEGIYVTGTQYLAWKNSSSYDPNKDIWNTSNPTNFYSKGREWERPVSVSIFEEETLTHTQEMGIRIKGASTRNSQQKNFNLYARSEYGDSKLDYAIFADNISEATGKQIKKYDSISLRGIGYWERIRDGIAQSALEGRELGTQTMRPCAVFLDGEYWGLYEMTEKYSDYFLQTHYDVPKENVVLIKNSELEEGTTADADEFYALMDSFKTMDFSNATQYEAICKVIDMDSFMEHFCAGLYLGTVDWPNWNYAMWKYKGEPIAGNPYTDGKWRFMSFDFDYCMGLTYDSYGGVEGYAYDDFEKLSRNAAWGLPMLFVRLMKNQDFCEQFVNTYCDYANEVMTPERVQSILQSYQEQYTPWMTRGIRRWIAVNDPPTIADQVWVQALIDKTCTQIETFLTNRAEYTLEDMETYFGIQNTLKTLHLTANGNGSFRVNTITPTLTNGSWSGQYSTKYPVTITAVPAEGQTFTGWSGDLQTEEATIVVSLQEVANLQANFGGATTKTGDVNTDGSVDATDVALLQDWLLNRTVPDTLQLTNADLDGNGVLNVTDLMQLKRNTNTFDTENLLTEKENWWLYTEAAEGKMTVERVDCLTIHTTQAGEKIWFVQAIYDGLTLEKGKTYQLTYTIQSEQEHLIAPHVQEANGGSADYTWQLLTTDPTAKTYTQTFTMSETCANAKVSFDCGSEIGTYEITDICLKEVRSER